MYYLKPLEKLQWIEKKNLQNPTAPNQKQSLTLIRKIFLSNHNKNNFRNKIPEPNIESNLAVASFVPFGCSSQLTLNLFQGLIHNLFQGLPPFHRHFTVLQKQQLTNKQLFFLYCFVPHLHALTSFVRHSVIPFLRLSDFKKDFFTKVDEMLQEYELHKKQLQALRLLKQKEDQLQKNILLINEMRRAILNSYYKKT